MHYVLTGRPGAANEVESALLQRFRESSADVQGAVLRALGIPAIGQKAAAVAITGGTQGQVVAGNVDQRGVTINVGGKKKGRGKVTRHVAIGQYVAGDLLAEALHFHLRCPLSRECRTSAACVHRAMSLRGSRLGRVSTFRHR